MLPSNPAKLRRMVYLGGLIVSVFFGQQALTKIMDVINTISVMFTPAA